jgi:chitodextrinase
VPRGGELVADLDAKGAAGAPGEAFDTAALAKGRWCYAVFAIGPQGRYARARTVKIVHPGPDLSPARIGLAATVAPAAGVRVRLTWTTPAAPVAQAISVERATGPCPANPLQFSGSSVAEAPTTAGPSVVDDTDAQTPGGTWCYGVRFREDGFGAAPTLFLVQVDGVPEPPNAPPVASFEAYPASGSITDGTNEVFLSDGSSDPDGRIAAWQWNLGDGTTAADAYVSHVYTAPGSYVVTLVVTDDRGATATATQTITILP